MFSRRKGRCCITATRRSSNAPLNPPVVSFAASSNNSPVSPATHPRIPPRKCSSIFCQRSGVIRSRLPHFPRQPNLGQPPVAKHRVRRNLQHLGCLCDAQPAKEAQLDYLALSGVDDSESLQRIIECH